MIPKIIWQTHQWEYQDLPDHIKRVALNWQNLNPDYEYKYCSAKERENYIERYDRLLFQYFKLARPVIQSDIWRFIVIQEHGGFYADMDSICISPIDYVMNNYYKSHHQLITRGPGYIWENGEGIGKPKLELESSNFGAVPQHKVFQDILEDIKFRYFNLTIQDIAKNDLILWLGPEWGNSNIIYSDHALNYSDTTCFEFLKASYHYGSQGKFNDYKLKFDDTFSVDYFGQEISYKDLAEKNNWLY